MAKSLLPKDRDRKAQSAHVREEGQGKGDAIDELPLGEQLWAEQAAYAGASLAAGPDGQGAPSRDGGCEAGRAPPRPAALPSL